jgi:hypothetical protein
MSDTPLAEHAFSFGPAVLNLLTADTCRIDVSGS